MTKTEAEKKFVAEWMGYPVKVDNKGNLVWFDTYTTYKTHHHFDCTFEAWNPNESRDWWDEIWENMSGDFMFDYAFALTKKLCPDEELQDWSVINNFVIHKAKPQICWPVLIQELDNKTKFLAANREAQEA